MPAAAGGDEHRRAVAGADLGLRLGAGFLEHHRLDRLAFLVEAVELGGETLALGRIVAGEEPRAERRVADPPAGIDARPEHEAEMIAASASRRAGRRRRGRRGRGCRAAPW